MDENGCRSSASFQLRIRPNELVAPSAFSPNGLGGNERFTGYSSTEAITIQSLTIFDRWGEMVFALHDFLPNDESIGWDGTHRGEPMNPGVFVYVFEYTDPYRGSRILTGDLTLMR